MSTAGAHARTRRFRDITRMVSIAHAGPITYPARSLKGVWSSLKCQQVAVFN